METASGSRTLKITIAEAGRVLDLETTSRLIDMRPELIEHYCQLGLLTPLEVEEGLRFDDDAIYTLRMIATLRREHIPSDGIRMIMGLMNEVERLRTEVRFLREQL